MAKLPLDKDTILRYSDRKSYQRGEEYYESGAVTSLVRRGNTVTADVEGSMDDYIVTVTFRGDGEIEAECDCPYEYGGWCKHIVAVMLTCLHDSEDVEEQPTLETLLEPLDRVALQMLVLKLAEENPRLAEDIVTFVESLQARPAASSVVATDAPAALTPLPVVNPSVIRKKIKAAVRSVGRGGYYEDDYYDEDAGLSELIDEVAPLIEDAEAVALAGDGRGALAALEAITEELATGWSRFSDMVGYISDDLGEDLGRVWTEAVLITDLTDDERTLWRKRLETYKKNLRSSGLDGSLQAAILALEQGWDYPPLVRVLQGEVTEKGAWEDEPDDSADLLAVARLNVLERQGRLQEATHLAEAEGQYERFLSLLVKTGRTTEAVEEGRTYITQPSSALQLARTLAECGESEKALDIAEFGLTVKGDTYTQYGQTQTHVGSKKSLADWLREYALTHGKTGLAIQAAMVGIREEPRLADYKRLKEISGAEWETLKEKILTDVSAKEGYGNTGAVDILLHEGRNSEALRVVSRGGDTHLLARVVEAATKTHPAEVIAPCREQADYIMDNKKSDRYDEAARWMERIREAYRAQGKMNEWQDYKEQTIAKHQKKYKLVPLLLAL
jgi:uncharacterized Zn finger protein